MKQTTLRIWLSICAALSASICSSVSLAEDYSATDVQLLYTTRSKADPVNGTGTSNEKLTSFRFEHYGTFKYGDSYLNFDNYYGENVGGPGAGSFGGNASNQQYATWMPRISLGKLLGEPLQFGPIMDVSLAARVEYASYGNFRAHGFGPSVDLKVPAFDYIQVRYLWRDTNYDKHHGFLHTAWGTAFAAGSRKVHFDGYFWTTATDSNGRRLFAEPDLTIDIDPKGTFQAGLRVTRDTYKLNGASYSRNSPQFILKWNL